jgi:adenine-specific DNA methylase
LIETATRKGDVILDCMAGGGTTLVEGLTVGRRVVSVDINPIAALVQAAQVAEYDSAEVARIFASILDGLPDEVRRWYSSACSNCDGEARVRWYERVYEVACPICEAIVPLGSSNLAVKKTGSKIRGRYVCPECSKSFSTADTPRIGARLLTARVKCGCGYQETRPVTSAEIALEEEIARREVEILDRHELHVPRDVIPLHWDRQYEDGLSRKGLKTFADLFTPRNRLLMAFILRGVRDSRPKLNEPTYLGVLLVASALIRYVNNMTVSTPGWMDGRPAACAKHAYWISNEFVECNPFEYLEHRLKAIRSAETDRRNRFQGSRAGDTGLEVTTRRADYCVIRADARQLDLPDASIDAVITDPPFGSNVQYGELTALWSVWLRDLNPYECADFLDEEILVTRRRKVDPKGFDDYEQGLTQVFRECHRVLKTDAPLIFTFNNRDARAWQAVMRAAFSAGFTLRPDDIAYQGEIHAYRDTAHLRFGEELQGDVVYAFRKAAQAQLIPMPNAAEWRTEAERRLASCHPADLQRERVAVHLETLAFAAAAIQQGLDEDAAERVSASLRLVSEAGRSR